MGTRTTVTNAEGLYRFPALAPGEYALMFTLDGFKAVRREGIHVGLGFTATVNVNLQVATLQENVIVERNSPVLDRQSTAIGATFDARQLADLPSARSMWTIQAATPAVYVARFDLGASATGLGGPISAYGTAGFNRPMVEGISVTGINPTGFTLNYGAFEEVSVSTAAHGPEWHSPGVHMQFVSKSGGNQYRGTLYADFGIRDWQSFNIDEGQVRRGAQGGRGLSPRDANRLWSYHDINADVGGYIKPDTVWWYFSVREQEVSARQVNFPVTPLRTSLTNYSGKTTYQLTPRNKLVAFGQAGRNHQPNRLDPFGPAGFAVGPATAINESEESTMEQLAWGWVWKGEWNSVINDTLYFEARVGQFGANRPQKPNGTAPRFEDVGNSHRRRRQSRLAGELSAQPGARITQPFQGWLVGEPPFQGRWRDLPNDSDRDLEERLSRRRAARAAERHSNRGVPVPDALEIGKRLVDVLCLRQRFLAGEQPPHVESGSAIRPLSRVPARAGAPGGPVQSDVADLSRRRQPDRLERSRTQDWACP